MRNRERIYEAGMRAAAPLVRLLAELHPRGGKAIEGRTRSEHMFAEWGATHREASRPLVLLHAPSVGEALMAQAIIHDLRILRPDVQIAFSFFSTSAERMAETVGADVSGYLPLDSRTAMRALVRSLRPTVVAFVRTEIWPVLGLEAAAAGARVAFVNAALHEDSSRIRSAARFMLGPAYRRLDAIGAVDHDSAQRFSAFDVDTDRVKITGDARFDQVWQRIRAIDRDSSLLQRLRGTRPLLVAGSTWPADEDVIARALASIPAERRPRIVLAPHAPSPTHLSRLEAALDRVQLRHIRLSALETSSDYAKDDVAIIVDRVGVLADLYAAASFAYIGGGFGRHGLHSVVEAAALGVPTMFGPALGNAQEAARLIAEGGGFLVHNHDDVADTIERLMADAAARETAGSAAEMFVREGLGASQRNAELIAGLIAPPR
ncbi:MAG: glycosyltransferase N-terminal domain-containing protein [Longimicrobiales bacterium]